MQSRPQASLFWVSHQHLLHPSVTLDLHIWPFSFRNLIKLDRVCLKLKKNHWDIFSCLETTPTPNLKALKVLHCCYYSSPLIFPSPILHPSSLASPSLCPLTVHSALCPHLTVPPPIKSSYLVSLPLSVLSLWPHLSSSSNSFILWFWSQYICLSCLLLSSCHPVLLLPLSYFPLSAAQASSPMDQHSYWKPKRFRGHIDPTDIPAECSWSTLMLLCCVQL